MDALTNAAVESLVKDVLPKLVKELAAAAKTPAETRAATDALKFLLGESYELLSLLSQWAGVEAKPQDGSASTTKLSAQAVDAADEMTDDDAMAMLAAAGGTDALAEESAAP